MVVDQEAERAEREERRGDEDRPAAQVGSALARSLPGRVREEHVGQRPEHIKRVPCDVGALCDQDEVDRVRHGADREARTECEPGASRAPTRKGKRPDDHREQ